MRITFTRSRTRRLQPGGEVEIFRGFKERPRIGDDFRGALAIAAVGRAEILPVDNLGEADDGIERRLDLMDHLAQRIMVGSPARNRKLSRAD